MYHQQRSLTFYHDHPLPLVHSPFPSSPFPLSIPLCTALSSLTCRALAPGMAPDPKGPPGLTRPKSSLSLSPSQSAPKSQQVFSPIPSQPRSSWFQLLTSPSLPPASLLTSTSTGFVENKLSTHPHVAHVQTMSHPRPDFPEHSASNFINNDTVISNIATGESSALAINLTDPWTRAHLRVCAHANDKCAACSIALICCSCRALRYTPGPPPPSPGPLVHRSRSASPILFRDVGNGSPPPDADSVSLSYDDDAYTRALAESDTCDNSGCPRGQNEPASWTITVQMFDEGSEEHYDRTFRACTACNRACKRSFMGHTISARVFDNSSKEFLNKSLKETLNKTDPPTDSRPDTPLQVFSKVARAHRISCSHAFSTCSTCSLGVTCCKCNNTHTAPARLKLRCAICCHHACDTCITPFCCSCRKPWFPADSPTLVLANRFRGGARSTRSSKKGSGSSSQSSGPGSLASARSQQPSPDPFAPVSAPGPLPTQSSIDEIDALTEKTIRVADIAAPQADNAPERSTRAPSPSSNLPSGFPPVFSRPPLPVVIGTTEDIPTAMPSRAPSRAASVQTTSSIGDDGIANEPQPPPFPTPVPPPAFNDVVGRIHRRFPLASLKVDDEDSRHFLARDNTRVDDIANETDYLLSSHTSWPSILYFIRDTMKFESIQGPITDFQVVLSGLAEIWSDASSFDARELLRDMLDASRLLPKAEREIDRLEAVSARYRTERNAVRTQLKTTDSELSRLRQAANDTLDSNARLLTEIDQLRSTDAVTAARERDEAQLALKDAVAHAKTAMAKQVCRYQHLAGIADERNSRIAS